VFAAPTTQVPDASTGARTSKPDQRPWDDVLSPTARLGPVAEREPRAEARPAASGERDPIAGTSPRKQRHSDSSRHNPAHAGGGRAGAAAVPGSTTDTGRSVAVGGSTGGRSLIGDALFRELVENALPRSDASDAPSSGGDASVRTARQKADPASDDTVVFERDRRFDPTVAVPPVHLAGEGAGAPAGQHAPSPVNGASEPAVGAAERRTSPPAGPTAPAVRQAASPSAAGGDVSASVPEAGSPSPVGGTRRPAAVGRADPVVDDTLRVGAAPLGSRHPLRNGHHPPPGPNSGDGSAAEAP
jgi:hypothetical protein